jgi:hypothetical protein
LNPRPVDLEATALPTELHPCVPLILPNSLERGTSGSPRVRPEAATGRTARDASGSRRIGEVEGGMAPIALHPLEHLPIGEPLFAGTLA